jgi:hypothetical protein
MATTITTTTGTTSPTRFNHQKHYDRCGNGVRWQLIHRPADNRLEFWYSIDLGATWTEYTPRRLSSIDSDAGASMVIGARSDGVERIGVTYTVGDRVRVSLGAFGANRQTFTWQQSGLAVAGTVHGKMHPDLELLPIGDYWVMPVFWSYHAGTVSRLYWTRARWGQTGSASVNAPAKLHERVSSVSTRPTVAFRHLGDRSLVANPHDLYVAWAQGASGDPQPRQYLMRMTARGTTWDPQAIRVLRGNAEGEYAGVYSGSTAACFTGQTVACVRAPDGTDSSDPASLQLHLMDPVDARREVVDVPALGKGNVVNVGVTWDTYNGDIYIVACGATDQTLARIKYTWATRVWGAWTAVNADGAVQDSLGLRQGSLGNRVDGTYAIVSGSNRAARHELVTTTNTPPFAATWLEDDGPRSTTASLAVGPWSHNDVDGDPQAQYTLERHVNDGATEYWNGVSWQTTLVNVSSAASSVTFSAGWATPGDVIDYRVRTSDGAAFGPWSDTWTITAATVVTVAIVSPGDESTVTVQPLTVVWSAAEQSAYLVELKTGDGVGLVYSSGQVGESGFRTHEIPMAGPDGVELVNGAAYDVEVTVWSDAGLASATAKHDFTASLIPPPLPSYTWVGVSAEGAIDVTVNNGTPGGGEAAAVENDIYQTIAGVELFLATAETPTVFRDRRVPWETEITYRIVARTAAGATRESV